MRIFKVISKVIFVLVAIGVSSVKIVVDRILRLNKFLFLNLRVKYFFGSCVIIYL